MHANSSTVVICRGRSSLSCFDFPHFHSASGLNTRTPQSGRQAHIGHTSTAAQHPEGIKQFRHWLDTPEPWRDRQQRRQKKRKAGGGGWGGSKRGFLQAWETRRNRKENRYPGWEEGEDNITDRRRVLMSENNFLQDGVSGRGTRMERERSENVYRHRQRDFNTRVCVSGVKKGTLIESPPLKYTYKRMNALKTQKQNLRIDLQWSNFCTYIYEKTRA